MQNQLTHSQDSPAKNTLRSRILTTDTFGSENVARISGSAEDETQTRPRLGSNDSQEFQDNKDIQVIRQEEA